jgi:hypothetical protein
MEGETYIDQALGNLYRSFIEKQDEILLKRLEDLGFDPNDHEFIKENMQRIIIEGNEFEHFYYHYGQPDEIRILSIQREIDHPPLDLRNPDFNNKMTISKKYY